MRLLDQSFGDAVWCDSDLSKLTPPVIQLDPQDAEILGAGVLAALDSKNEGAKLGAVTGAVLGGMLADATMPGTAAAGAALGGYLGGQVHRLITNLGVSLESEVSAPIDREPFERLSMAQAA